MTWTLIFRLAAIVLLLLTGAEIFACEMINPQQCESFGFPKPDSGDSADDNCICCCTHVVVIFPNATFPVADRVADVVTQMLAKPEYKSFSIYHPPKA